jgi:dolichol-phosphate mannosyltransferase
LTPEISIIVPVYNEAANVAPLVEQVRAAFASEARPWELVLVDDASTDATWDEILGAARLDRRIRGLRHERNRGQSAAVWTGVEGTTSPLLCTLDGDLQNDPADLPKMLALLGNVDFVCGKRTNRRDTWFRRISSRVARSARKAALGSDFQDTGCAVRAFKRSSLTGVFPFNGLHRFLPILVAGNGSKCLEVPVNHRPRIAGVSKYGLWNRLGRGIWDLAAMAWYKRRRLNSVAVADSRTVV